MKKTDIALIIIIVSISAGIAYWVAGMTIGQSNDEPIIVRTADTIEAGDIKVDSKVFAEQGINPTVEATISGEDLTSFIDEGDAEEADDNTVEE